MLKKNQDSLKVMKTQFYQKRNIFRAKYSHNKVMHLIIACSVAYIMLQAISIIFLVITHPHHSVFQSEILPNIALQGFSGFLHHPWVLFTYFWLHASFLFMLSNMLWLYCFGSVIQSFVGHKEIFPMFIFSSVLAGIGYVVISYFFKAISNGYELSALSGVLAFAVGSFVLVPHYRFYLTEHFSIPLWLVLVIFLILNVLTVSNSGSRMVLLGFSALAGATYIWLLKAGYRPGNFFYGIGSKIQSAVTPAGRPVVMGEKRSQTLKISKHQVIEHPSSEYIDSLLDKISQKGFKSLTSEEKQSLKNAGK